jgi:hypothetical protein
MTTSTSISFGANAIAIKTDSTAACPDVQPFVDLTDLKTGLFNTLPYATYEPDFWLLDGNYKFKPTTAVHVGLMSLQMSNNLGGFGTDIVLTITFGSVHSTNGLRLVFSQYTGDWATSMDVSFYDSSNVLIRTDDYFPSGWEFSTNQAVSNFKKIVITFFDTNKAYRYLRLKSIDFDDLTTFSGTAIKAAQLIEQINPLSVELPINTIDLTIFSADGDFSIVNPAGFYANLQNNEPLEAFEIIDGQNVYLGRFYLSDWSSASANLANFRAVDAIGLLDKDKYLTTQEGCWNNSDTTTTIITEILSGTGFTASIDASLASTGIPGWAPALTKRGVLQQILFRLGAYATCARSSSIVVKPTVLASSLSTWDYTLTGAEKGLESPVTLRPKITGVRILSSYYKYVTANKDIFSGTLTVGDNIIMVPEDVILETYIITPGTGTKTFDTCGANHVLITVSVEGTFTITADTYFERITRAVDNPSSLGISPISIEDATLITDGINTTKYDIVSGVSSRVSDYYSQRYLQKTKLFASLIAVGNSVLIDTQAGKKISGIVERMETDLAGGFISKVDIIGVVQP